jgi:GAF domain-containing protein
MTVHAARPAPAVSVDRLQSRIEELEAERRKLLAIIDLLRELAGAASYRDIVQTVARRLGHALGLERCSVFLAERSVGTVHLVASYEDPSLRSHPIDLSRYPELKRALETGDVVNIPDVSVDPTLDPVQPMLAHRQVRSITVIPLVWRTIPIGAVFLRTDRARAPLAPADIEWGRRVADVTAHALRAAHRIERLQSRLRGGRDALLLERERAALLAFLRRLLASFAWREAEAGEELVPRAGDAELERLVGVALRVLEREATR